MSRITSLVAALAIAASASAVQAGGLDEAQDDAEPVVVVPTSSFSAPGSLGGAGAAVAVGGLLLVGAALSNSGSH